MLFGRGGRGGRGERGWENSVGRVKNAEERAVEVASGVVECQEEDTMMGKGRWMTAAPLTKQLQASDKEEN